MSLSTRRWERTHTAYDPCPVAKREHTGPRSPECRAQMRAELGAHYTHRYGLTKYELRYTLDPAGVTGPNYPNQTVEELKNGVERRRRLAPEASYALESNA